MYGAANFFFNSFASAKHGIEQPTENAVTLLVVIMLAHLDRLLM